MKFGLKKKERGLGWGGSGVYRGSKPPAPLSGGHVNTNRKYVECVKENWTLMQFWYIAKIFLSRVPQRTGDFFFLTRYVISVPA